MKVILSEFIFSVLGRGVLLEIIWSVNLMERFDFEDLRVDGATVLK